MSEQQEQSANVDDLLKNAIPIDEGDGEDDVGDLEEITEEQDQPQDTVKSGYAAEAVPTIELSEEPSDSKRQVESLGAKAARQEMWTREVDRTSSGASHVRTFTAKTTKEGIAYMDEQINTWLAENPDVVVKFVTVVPGDIIGRTRDPSLFISVWV